MTKAERLRQKMAHGQLVTGGHVFSGDPQLAELMGRYGYDFVWIDGEHSALDLRTVLGHIMACAAGDTAAFVRVPWNDPVRIKQVLEMGPDGLIVPFVCGAREAAQAVAACRYPPAGVRGFGPRRAGGYGAVPRHEYLEGVDQSILKIMQIEHRDGVNSLPEILAVPGVDMIVIGPNDLSASYGHLEDIAHPEMMPVYDYIVNACREAGIPCGASIGAQCPGTISQWLNRGLQFLACGDDFGFVAEGAQRTLARLRAEGGKAGEQ